MGQIQPRFQGKGSFPYQHIDTTRELNGSLGSWVTLSDPFPALVSSSFSISCG